MSTRTRRVAALAGGLLLAAGSLAACGDDDDVQTTTDDAEEVDDATDGAADPGSAAGTCLEGTEDCVDTPMDAGPAAGMCLEGATDCEDTVMDPDESVSSPAGDGGGSVGAPGPADEDFPAEAARQRAKDQLGRPEAQLEPDIRVGRRGDEQMMLTEDYVLGRITVELDADGSTFVVTQATVELPDGPETFTLDQD